MKLGLTLNKEPLREEFVNTDNVTLSQAVDLLKKVLNIQFSNSNQQLNLNNAVEPTENNSTQMNLNTVDATASSSTSVEDDCLLEIS